MDIYEALYTTRAMRRREAGSDPARGSGEDLGRRDPCAEWGQRGGVEVPTRRRPRREGPSRAAVSVFDRPAWKTIYADRLAGARANPDDPDSIELLKIQRSAQWLADHFESVPLFLLGFIQIDSTGGSIYPAVWSAELAARAEGVGSALTSILGVFRSAETFEVLGVPSDQGWIFACLVSFGYPTGRWGVAPRTPAHDVAFRNVWGRPTGLTVPEPLWP